MDTVSDSERQDNHRNRALRDRGKKLVKERNMTERGRDNQRRKQNISVNEEGC